MKLQKQVLITAVFTGACMLTAGAQPVVSTASYGAPMAFGVSGYVQDHDRDRGWETPPGEFDEYARRGFHEGVEGARRDFGNHRRPDVHNREEFRHPRGVPFEFREAYRRGFERGYNVGVEHIYGRR